MTADPDAVPEDHAVNSNARIAAVAAAIVAPPVPLQVAESHLDFPNTTRSRLRHDREQLAFLMSPAAPSAIAVAPELAAPAVAAYDEVIAQLGGLNPSGLDQQRSQQRAPKPHKGVDGGGDEQAEVSAKGGMGGSGGGGDGEGGTDGGGGGNGWLRDADIYMSERVTLTTPQQARLAPYYNRELARRDEPRIPGGALGWGKLKVRTLSTDPLVMVVDDVFRPDTVAALLRFTRGTTMWTNVKKQGYLCA